MISLPLSARAWPGQDFKPTLKAELEALDKAQLPLQQGLSYSSYVGTAPFSVTVLGVEEQAAEVLARVGVFYTGIIAGCNCSDDPTPVDEQNEYCELLIRLDGDSGQARVELDESGD